MSGPLRLRGEGSQTLFPLSIQQASARIESSIGLKGGPCEDAPAVWQLRLDFSPLRAGPGRGKGESPAVNRRLVETFPSVAGLGHVQAGGRLQRQRKGPADGG